MAKGLVIVESPAKAKTIKGFLGEGFEVQSCFGHVRDLPKGELGVDVENGFKPRYIIPNEKKKVIANLKKHLKQSEIIWLATDEDREGEAISWHLVEALKLNRANTRRIVFHEITKKAILSAVSTPRELDDRLVMAQQARRVLDRLVGYNLSPVLWKKVRAKLSAGRVQSVAVKLVVAKEKEYSEFVPQSNYKITTDFVAIDGDTNSIFSATLKNKPDDEQKALKILEQLKKSVYYVKNIEQKPTKRSPSPPFTTSTLQQEAGRRLGMSVKQTMRYAQQLYEEGKITYMRTDSVNLSDTAIAESKEEICNIFGNQYFRKRQYQTKSKGAQEAHEAIRPTSMAMKTLQNREGHKKLYELIWQRTLASQMSDAELEKTVITIDASSIKEDFVAKGEVLKFDGFLRVYHESKQKDNEKKDRVLLPDLNINDKLKAQEVKAVEGYTKPPARYSEAGLVRKLEELGIGRPSTYAPTISLIQDRGYVIKRNQEGISRQLRVIKLKDGEIKSTYTDEITGVEKNKLVPTDTGKVVNDFLDENFKEILDYNFTANVEEEFDKIAIGELEWNKMLKDFYGDFKKTVELVLQNSPKVSGERLLGVDPVSGKNVYAKIGRFGPMIQIGESTKGEEKPRFAGLTNTQSISTITLEEALALFKFPLEIGDYEGKQVKVNIGKHGPYITYDGNNYSLEKGSDPFTINIEKAGAILKTNKHRNLGQFEDEDIVTGLGRFGPFVKHKNQYFSLPKSISLSEVSLEEAIELIEKKRASKKS